MDIITAKSSGFCFGVKRAVEAVNKNIDKKNLRTFGPIIHNQQVVQEFEAKGVHIANNSKEAKYGTIVVRSHGISPQIQQELSENSLEVIDATCPFVKRIHKLAQKHYELGYQLVLYGTQDHPEMIGVNGWCNNTALFVKSVDEVRQLPAMKDVCLASQTTMSKEEFEKIKEAIKEKIAGDLQIYDTICNATEERQEAAKVLAQKVNKVIVVGGYNSSNTQKLVSICQEYCDYVIHIEISDELPLQDFNTEDKIGITAGASTPDWIIENVINSLKQYDERCKKS